MFHQGLAGKELSLKIGLKMNDLELKDEIELREAYEVSDHFVKEIFAKIITQKFHKLLPIFFKKIHYFYLELSNNDRKELVKFFYKNLEKLELVPLVEYCKDSLVGNHLWLFALSSKMYNVDVSMLDLISNVERLQFQEDLLSLNPQFDKKCVVEIDERILGDRISAQKSLKVQVLWYLHLIGLLESTEDIVRSFKILYSTNEPIDKLKASLISSMLEGKEDEFIRILKRLNPEYDNVSSILDLDLMNLFNFVIFTKVPVYFDWKNVRYNGTLSNRNFFFLKYRNTQGEDKIVQPYSNAELNLVSKIYDMYGDTWFTPTERFGKLLPEDIHSFIRIKEIKDAAHEIERISSMSEDMVEAKLREILMDQGNTPHTPIEIADIFSTKIKINNESDLRNAAFILKGSSYSPQVTLKTVANQILKVFDLPIDLVIFIYVTSMGDDAKQKFIEQCELRRKMYCILGPDDLARLFVAYDLM